MSMQNIINTAWDNRVNLIADSSLKDVIQGVMSDLDSGKLRVAEKQNCVWVVNEWVKKAILLSFKINQNTKIGEQNIQWFDKVMPKFANWSSQDFMDSGIRAVPGSFARQGSFIAKNVILMPSFVNVGAYVDEGTMVDTWATIGSCAQIGKNCHISGGVGIGGVLEPLQANPVIIEDNCFIGARSEVAEGVIVREGAVLSMGVYLGASTKIVDRETGEIFYGEVPPYSVIVPGTIPGKKLANGLNGPSLYAAIIVKKVDAQTRSKTSINELLRAA